MSEMNFDPITGQPLNNQNNNTQNSTMPIEQNNLGQIPNQEIFSNQIPATNNANDNINDRTNQTAVMMQTVATVNQTQENFISNVQNENKITSEKKENKPNYWFIIILFIIILAAIFFLFPFLLKTL